MTKKNASADSLTCAMFIKYKLKVYFKDAHELSEVFISETSWNQYSKNCFFPSLEFNAGISSTLWQKWQLYDTLPGRKGNKESEKLCGITIVDSMRNYPTSVTNIFVFLDWLMYLSRGFIQKIATIFSRTFQRPHFIFKDHLCGM